MFGIMQDGWCYNEIDGDEICVYGWFQYGVNNYIREVFIVGMLGREEEKVGEEGSFVGCIIFYQKEEEERYFR